MKNAFDEKDFYSIIAKKIDEECDLNALELEILFKGLRGDDELKLCVLYLFENEDALDSKILPWLKRGLNDYYLFAPVWNINGVCGFRIEERNREFENKIKLVACALNSKLNNERE